jgi:nodulation protein E
MAHRVVVTGWGVVSSIGQTATSCWSNLVRGISGIADATIIPADQLSQKIVAEVKNFDPRSHFDDRQIAMLDRVSQLAVVAGREAVAHAAISFDDRLSERTATIIGTGVGGQTTQDESYKRLYREGAKRLHPLKIPKLMVNAPASQVSMHCGLREAGLRGCKRMRLGNPRHWYCVSLGALWRGNVRSNGGSGRLHHTRHDEGLGSDACDGARYL